MKKIRENIKVSIVEELSLAKSEILIAVCWFTDVDLFNLIIQKREEGISVEVILTNDHTNFQKSRINWHKLSDIGGKVYLYKKGHLMHLKECIIDNQVCYYSV